MFIFVFMSTRLSILYGSIFTIDAWDLMTFSQAPICAFIHLCSFGETSLTDTHWKMVMLFWKIPTHLIHWPLFRCGITRSCSKENNKKNLSKHDYSPFTKWTFQIKLEANHYTHNHLIILFNSDVFSNLNFEICKTIGKETN